MQRHIYTDEQTQEIEESLLKVNRNFNFSDIYKKALKNALERINTHDIVYLNNMLNEQYNKKAEAEDNIKHYMKLIEEFTKKENLKKQVKEQQEIKTLSERDQKIKDFSESIADLWCDLCLPKETILNLATDFHDNYFKTMSLFEFMEIKGYKTNLISEPGPKQKVIHEKDISIIESVSNKEYEDLMKIASGGK